MEVLPFLIVFIIVSFKTQSQDESYRRRSYAQPECDLSPKLKHLRRSHSMGERTTRLLFSIDSYYLRGWGLTSYHVYEVSVSFF